MSGLTLLVHLPFSLRTVVSLVFVARILTLNRRGGARRGVVLRARCRLPNAYTLATNKLFAEHHINHSCSFALSILSPSSSLPSPLPPFLFSSGFLLRSLCLSLLLLQQHMHQLQALHMEINPCWYP